MAAVILVIIAIVVVALFSIQNAMPVVISLLAWQFDASLALIALLFFLAGMVTGMIVLSLIQVRRRARKRSSLGEKLPNSQKSPDHP